MGKFSQKIGQKLKAGASLGLKVGAVAGGLGMAYLGMKSSPQTQRRVDEDEVARQVRKAEIEGMMDDYNKQHGTNLGQPKNKSYRRERGLPERTKTP